MSLKDRLNTPIKQNTIREEAEPKYYESDVVAKQITLGVLDEILIDDEISAVYVNGPKNIYIEKKGSTHKTLKTFRDNIQLTNIIKKNAKDSGAKLDEKAPMVTFEHRDGIKVTATLPPLSNNVCVYVKCYYDKFANLSLMQEQGIISKETALVLEIVSGLKNNIIITGEKASLKTSFLSALAKKTAGQNTRNVLIDYSGELKTDSSLFVTYDFSTLNKTNEFLILNTIILSNPDRLFINDPDIKTVSSVINAITDGFGGFVININSKGKTEALEKLTRMLLKEQPYLTYEKAKETVYEAFDLILYTKSDKEGRRLETLSQIKTNKIEDIFFVNDAGDCCSNGIIPDFYEQIRLISPFNTGIFDKDYKHTKVKNDSFRSEALKRFKKDSDTPVVSDNSTDEPETKETTEPENVFDEESFDDNAFETENNTLDPSSRETTKEDELVKKARDKFSELKKNIKLRESLKDDTDAET